MRSPRRARRPDGPRAAGARVPGVLVCGALLSACASVDRPDAASLLALDPAAIRECTDTPARLRGANLENELSLNLDNHDPAALVGEWDVRFGDHRALAVEWASSIALDVTIPALPAGAYDVTAITPARVRLTLPGALTVAGAALPTDGGAGGPGAGCSHPPVHPSGSTCAGICSFQFGSCLTSSYPGLPGTCGPGVANRAPSATVTSQAILGCLQQSAIPAGALVQIDFDYEARGNPPKCRRPPILAAVSSPSGRSRVEFAFGGCVNTSGFSAIVLPLPPGESDFTLSVTSGDWGSSVRVRAVTVL